jgi:hypothetical protein
MGSAAVCEGKSFPRYVSIVLGVLTITAYKNETEIRKGMIMAVRILIAAMEVMKANGYRPFQKPEI